jgi:hypothetical protein
MLIFGDVTAGTNSAWLPSANFSFGFGRRQGRNVAENDYQFTVHEPQCSPPTGMYQQRPLSLQWFFRALKLQIKASQ